MRWWLKSCPKCRGDLFRDRSWEELTLKCLQCGHTLSRLQQGLLRFPSAKPAIPARAEEVERRKAA
ncbi:MAG: hypothetical protein EXR60_03875 [Dehalococcoidia bacterium]|nr:hypothetical protein [Dehalococcoidia bacterium]